MHRGGCGGGCVEVCRGGHVGVWGRVCRGGCVGKCGLRGRRNRSACGWRMAGVSIGVGIHVYA